METKCVQEVVTLSYPFVLGSSNVPLSQTPHITMLDNSTSPLTYWLPNLCEISLKLHKRYTRTTPDQG